MKAVPIIQIVRYYGYPDSILYTASQDFLNTLIRKYYTEHSKSA